MRLTSTKSRAWVYIASLLTTMALGCGSADGEPNALENELARKAGIGDGGASTDAGGDPRDASIALVDGGASAPAVDKDAAIDDQADAAEQLTDNQIFGIIVAYNDAELSAAAAGEGKLRGRASTFASVVALSANAVASRQTFLAQLADLTAEDSTQASDREQAAGDIDSMLKTEPPSDSLDLRYAFAEAMSNQTLIQLIDSTLLPQADSELLRTELRTTRDAAQRRVTEGGNVVTALAPAIAPKPDDTGSADPDTSDADAGEPQTSDTDAGSP